ncbi:MAG: ECF transporter S component [Breznakia sp.]
MSQIRIKQMTIIALAMSIIFLMTVVIVIPISTKGYVNLGDIGVLFFASFFSPLTAGFVGGMGSALADVVAGYSHYAVFTLLIKGLEGLVVSYLFHHMSKKYNMLSFVVGIVIMVSGYYVVDFVIEGNVIAVLPSLFANAIQGIICLISAFVLRTVLFRELYKYRELFK